jgi:peptidoglycan/xylan/chitin deacetylase (PgdA/CDA1 family)
MGYGEPNQWILSLGTYGYDWNTTTKKTTTIGFTDAMARAQRAGLGPVNSSEPRHNPSFTYDVEGQSHEVWFLDASTFANQLRASDQEGCAGILISQLGTEDPSIWPVLDQHSPGEPSETLLDQLKTIDPKELIAQVGDGVFLTAELDSRPGRRKLWLDSGGYVSETYEAWPTYASIVHFEKAEPHEVALTFDDGPDPKYTPQILDILRQYGAQATFFVIGRNAENHPDLVRRILKDGHEIGNHTYTHPNLSEAKSEQITLELNATQRLIEWLTGRSTILLRPPYIADSMPATLAEARPIALATDLGYITVGESVDPEDWEKPGVDEIMRRVKEQRSAGGNVILLHDAGGDRAQTLAALPQILQFFKDRGDTVVPAGRLLGLNRDQSMPSMVERATSIPMIISNAGLMAFHWCEEFLWAFMIVTSLLTILRSIALAILSLSRKPPPTSNTFVPSLSVLIAAYNEEKVPLRCDLSSRPTIRGRSRLSSSTTARQMPPPRGPRKWATHASKFSARPTVESRALLRAPWLRLPPKSSSFSMPIPNFNLIRCGFWFSLWRTLASARYRVTRASGTFRRGLGASKASNISAVSTWIVAPTIESTPSPSSRAPSAPSSEQPFTMPADSAPKRSLKIPI